MEARLILLKLQRFLRIDRKLKIAKNAKKVAWNKKKLLDIREVAKKLPSKLRKALMPQF